MDISELGDNRVRVTLKGRLDTPGVGQIEGRFTAQLLPRRRHAMVDMSQVEFITSLGLRMLISTARLLGRDNARFVLFAPQEPVQEVFDSVSLAELIPIFADEADALKALDA
jgi:anti-anti-sigma factor